MSLTINPNDENLLKTKENGQQQSYLVASKEERQKGFIRPYRDTYIHVGKPIERTASGAIDGRLIKIEDNDYPHHEMYTRETGYGGYLKYPKERHPLVGRYLKQEEVDAIIGRKLHVGGCGVSTKMDREIAETYARNPRFYRGTFCVGCKKHLPVEEFVWEDGSKLGS